MDLGEFQTDYRNNIISIGENIQEIGEMIAEIGNGMDSADLDDVVADLKDHEKDLSSYISDLKTTIEEFEEISQDPSWNKNQEMDESRSRHGRMLKEDAESSWAIDGFEEGNPMPSPYREVYNTKYEALDNAIALVEEYPEMCIGVRKAEAASRGDFEEPYVYCVATEENKKVAMREFGGKFIGVEG